MSDKLPASLVDRLCKLCGMLGSDHAGERAAAALKADALLREHGLRWPDVIRPQLPVPESERVVHHGREWPSKINPAAAAFVLRTCPELLTEWQHTFCQSVAGQRSLSRKQWGILRSIVDKCRRRACGGAYG